MPKLNRPPLLFRVVVHALVVCIIAPTSGCTAWRRLAPGPHDTTASYHDNYGINIAYPQVAQCAGSCSDDIGAAALATMRPLTLEDPSELPTFDLSLAECVRIAVANSPVIRNIGGTIVNSPTATQTVFNPALSASSPQSAEAALAAFDANYTQQLFWNNTDQPSNRQPFSIPGTGGNPPLIFAPFVQSRGATFVSELNKQTATGARFALRHNVNYLKTQDPSFLQQRFPSSFVGFLEAEYRQPLMQGAGTLFNRIAGPTPPGSPGNPGVYNGVLIARINEDLSLAEFENAVIALINDVEQSYWQLTTAYRVLAANVAGRDSAQQTFQFQKVRLEVGTGRADEEAQARSQFYQFQAQVEQSLGGPQGLYALEQQLRYLIGLPATDGRLIRPSTDPTDVQIVFDWESAVGQALSRRVEIRRQKFNVKRRELELIAARLGRKPRLDLLAVYRWRGFGDRLLGSGDDGEFDNFYDTLTDGDFQEGQLGVEMTWPVGLRAASLAVQNAKLNLRRERAVLCETELRISHDLSTAARGVELNFQLVETNYNRYQSDLRQVEVLRRRYRDGNDPINFLLQAQQQVVASETAFYQSLSNYNLAIRDLHREKGSLLAYSGVGLAEGPWCPGAAEDAQRVGRFLEPRRNPDAIQTGPIVASGGFDPSAIQPGIDPGVSIRQVEGYGDAGGESSNDSDDDEPAGMIDATGSDDPELVPTGDGEIENEMTQNDETPTDLDALLQQLKD